MYVSSDMSKNSRVGRSGFFLIIFFIYYGQTVFSNRFCFFYTQIIVIIVQIGNRYGLLGILCPTDHTCITASLSMSNINVLSLMLEPG